MRLNISFIRFLFSVLPFLPLLAGCVEESPVTVVFDQELKSVTFENRLFTPLVLYRDGAVLDTLRAEETRTYPLNRRGIVRHAWQIIPPRGVSGNPAGISPYVDLGVQYAIEARYTIRNTSVPGETIFTPRIANFTLDDLWLVVNYDEEDEFLTNYILRRNQITSDTHAPYFYWNSGSNIYLDPVNSPGFYRFSRNDSGDYGLELDNGARFGDAGATTPITVR